MINMSEQQVTGGYGYTADDVRVGSNLVLGLNQGAKLIKFEWIPNAGKEGAEAEALDIVFDINGVQKSWRKFPVTKAFDKNNNDVTDPNSKEMKEAFSTFNSIIVHLLHCYQTIETVKAGMAVKIETFKDYCINAMRILPANYKDLTLDIFMHYQWQIDQGQSKTFLDIPKSMKTGKFFATGTVGDWEEHRVEKPKDNVTKALWYTNEKGEEHVFVRNGWFLNSNYATQQVSDATGNTGSSSAAKTTQAAPAATEAEKKATPASSW